MILGLGQTVKYHYIFGYHVNFKDFYTKPCVCCLGHAPRVVFGALGCPGGRENVFKHGNVAYQINGNDKQNRMQVKISS